MILLVISSGTARAADGDPAALAYQRALSRYASGDIKGALTDMRDSLRLSGRWELLYNIARLQDELGDCGDALANYREYLERVSDGQYRAQAAQASSELQTRCPPAEAPSALATTGEAASVAVVATTAAATPALEPAPMPAPVAPSQSMPPSDSSGSAQRWLGWSAIAAGGLAGVGAVYFTVSAHDARSDYARSVSQEEDGGARADDSLQDKQHRDARWAQVLAVTGGALLGGGVVLLVLSGRKQPASAGVTAGVWLSPGGISGQLSSRF